MFVLLQGTIFSKTAMENYKEFGPQLFKMSVPFSPAKRLGVPEEVCELCYTSTLLADVFTVLPSFFTSSLWGDLLPGLWISVHFCNYLFDLKKKTD